MRVLLINPLTIWRNDRSFETLRNKNFNDHLGLRYIASSLESEGHIVDIIDAHFEEISFNDILDRIKYKKYDFYGISFVEAIVEKTITLVEHIRKVNPDSMIFVGGYGSTLIGDTVLKNCRDIDLAFIGEGERSICQFANKVSNGKDWRDVPGIMYLDGDTVKRTQPLELVRDIDKLPWPKRGKNYKYGKANIIASRGCYGTCTYCSIVGFYKHSNGPRVRIRKAKNVVDEMEYVKKEYGVHHFDFVDDNFLVTCRNDLDWAIEFVNEIKKRKLNISFGIQSRANDVDEEVFEILKNGGLRFVSVGIENDSERVMKLFKTGTSKEIHRKAVNVLKKLGINMYIEMILLEPTAKLEEIKENIDFLEEVRFWELYIQNPVSYATKLHLYQKTPVAKQMEGYIDITEVGYHLQYKFKDSRVRKLDQMIDKWQSITSDLKNLHHSNLHFEASRNGLYHIGLKAIKISRRYLKFDLYFFKDLVDFINKNTSITKEQEEAFFNKYIGEADKLYNDYLSVYKIINDEAKKSNK